MIICSIPCLRSRLRHHSHTRFDSRSWIRPVFMLVVFASLLRHRHRLHTRLRLRVCFRHPPSSPSSSSVVPMFATNVTTPSSPCLCSSCHVMSCHPRLPSSQSVVLIYHRHQLLRNHHSHEFRLAQSLLCDTFVFLRLCTRALFLSFSAPAAWHTLRLLL